MGLLLTEDNLQGIVTGTSYRQNKETRADVRIGSRECSARSRRSALITFPIAIEDYHPGGKIVGGIVYDAGAVVRIPVRIDATATDAAARQQRRVNAGRPAAVEGRCDCSLGSSRIQITSRANVIDVHILPNLQRGVVYIVHAQDRALEQLTLYASIPLFRIRSAIRCTIDPVDSQIIANITAVARRTDLLGRRLISILDVDKVRSGLS